MAGSQQQQRGYWSGSVPLERDRPQLVQPSSRSVPAVDSGWRGQLLTTTLVTLAIVHSVPSAEHCNPAVERWLYTSWIPYTSTRPTQPHSHDVGVAVVTEHCDVHCRNRLINNSAAHGLTGLALYDTTSARSHPSVPILFCCHAVECSSTTAVSARLSPLHSMEQDEEREAACGGIELANQPSHSSQPPSLASVSTPHTREAADTASSAFRAFVPSTVQAFLLAQSAASPSLPSSAALLSRPSLSSYVGCLLFVDISGFTALSERLSQQGARGLELLTEHLNHYFTLIIDTIHQHGGDVVKFAGDALLCLFAQPWTDQRKLEELIDGRQEEEEADDEVSFLQEHDSGHNSHSPSSLFTARRKARSALIVHSHRACRCALSIHSALDFYSPTPSATLRLHSAIVSGLMLGLHVGGCRDRWEFVLEGEPLNSLKEAMHVSEKGQIVIHRSATRWVSRCVKVEPISSHHSAGTAALQATAALAASCQLLVGMEVTPVQSPSSGRAANLRKPHLTIVVPQPIAVDDSQWPLSQAAHLVPISRPRSDDSDRCAALAGIDHAVRGYVPSAILARVACGHAAWLAEFRRVATLFILLPYLDFGTGGPAMHAPISTGRETERRQQLLDVYQQRVQLIMEVCYAHKGDVRQLITDDKGTVMILLFGLHADWANPLLGVQAALAIHSRMAAERLGAVAIGVTTGQVFCGTVGSAVRREYTAVGDKVNTAARLMAAVAGRDGILVDADTVDAIGRNHPRVAFSALQPIQLKGKEQPVAVFTPRPVVASWSTGSSSSSGRRGRQAAEREAVMHSSLLAGARQRQQQQLTVFLQSSSLPCDRLYIDAASRGMSKSLLLRWAAHHCRQLKSHRVFLSRADEQDQTAYFAFQSLIPTLLHTLWKLHPSRRGKQRGGGGEQDRANDSFQGEASAEWLSDPSTLALPPQLAADSSPLLVLSQICPAVHFRCMATLQFELSQPHSPPARPIADCLDSSLSPPPARARTSSPSPPLNTASTCAKKDFPAGKVLSLLAALLSHAHSLSSDAECAGAEDVRAGTVLLVDDAHVLDSASEELLLRLSEQLPSIHFVFAGVHSREEGDELKSGAATAAAGSTASSQSLRKRLTAIDDPSTTQSSSARAPPPVSGVQGSSVSAAPGPPVPCWLAAKTTAVHQTYVVLLDRFSASDVSQLIQAELDCQHVCPSVTAFLLERSSGIPAFALEMLRALHKRQLLQLTMEPEAAIDENGRVRAHIFSSQHLEQVKEQSQRLQQHSRRSSTENLPPSSPDTSSPAPRLRALSFPLNASPTAAAPLPPLSLPAPAALPATVAASTVKLYRVCSFVPHWRESAIFSSLPASMDEMLAARFDACSPCLQLMLRMAAVFGRSIDRRCMRQLWQQFGCHKQPSGQSVRPRQQCGEADAAATDDMCRSLLSLGLLIEEEGCCSSSSSESVSYAFAQSSMQDMIYHRMPFSLRCRLHLAITAWYEAEYSGSQLQPFYSRLAYHFFQAVSPSLQQHDEADSATPSSASPDTSSTRATSSSTTSAELSPSMSSVSSSSTASSISSASTPTSNSSSTSPISNSTARYAAIRYLKLAAEFAIQQHAKREAVVALRQCQALLLSLPDADSLHWKREQLSVMALYAPTHTHLVGTALSMDAFAALLALCEDVQQMIESQQGAGKPSTGSVVADQTVLQTFYALRGFYFALLGSNMVREAHALAPRIEAIALASNDLLLLHHSWIVLAVTTCERGQLHEGISFCDRIIESYYKQQAESPTPYTVNPYAPMCPVVWGMGVAIQMLPLIGYFADVARRSEVALRLAESRAEPVAYQETIYHIVFGKHYLELPASAETAKYWAHVRASNYQMVSLQLECLFALQVDPRQRWGEFRESAVRVWSKLCAGAQFLLTLSVPLLQLLLSAGMWREGMAVVDRWKARAVRDGWMDGFHSECLRFQAQFKLLKAHEQLTLASPSSSSQDPRPGSVDSVIDELMTALDELEVGIHKAREFRVALMEARCLLTSVYIRQLLLDISIFPSSELPFPQLMAPPDVDLERPFQQLHLNRAKLRGLSVDGVRSQRARLAELVGMLEEQSDETVQSTFFHRARNVVQQHF